MTDDIDPCEYTYGVMRAQPEHLEWGAADLFYALSRVSASIEAKTFNGERYDIPKAGVDIHISPALIYEIFEAIRVCHAGHEPK